jgi:hypothetical protein
MTDSPVIITEALLAAQRKTTRMLFHAYGVIIGLAFFILNVKINPDEGFWMPLIGALVGTQLIGYFVAWRPFLAKRLIPFENEMIRKVQNTSLNPTEGS